MKNTNELESITIHPIGTIHTPYTDILNMPIQPIAAESVKGYIDLKPEFVPGLKDLGGFSYITLIYRFHRISGFALEVIPFMDNQLRGIFATRAPKRPNAIGISTVKITKIENNIIHIEQVDMLDGTPLIDIKPFYPRYDNREEAKIGWLEKNQNLAIEDLRSDGRFK